VGIGKTVDLPNTKPVAFKEHSFLLFTQMLVSKKIVRFAKKCSKRIQLKEWKCARLHESALVCAKVRSLCALLSPTD
jgi:hypothetical protein